jgi:two-component system CheB/CheR fusion protein
MSTKKSISLLPVVEERSPETDFSPFPIVGIGASAGGLEALEEFFAHMPKDNGMAFVVIQHLDPDHVGIMPELLQRITTMKVFQATDRLKVKPNCVYVIPPNKSLSLLQDALYLFEPVELRGHRLPINLFFNSLANDRKEKSVGIILSGMGSDGSDGLKAIKKQGGIVAVQDPASAKFDSMPRNAIAAVRPDIVASASKLPDELIAFLKFPQLAYADNDPDLEVKNISNLEKIIILLREQTGHDFLMYKKNTLFRRIERRKGIHQIDSIQSYVRFLQENPKEVELLFNELLIGVTSFFRDPVVWEALKDKVLPELINELPDGHVLRAWVTGCSTGEEAYSLAIVFKEAMRKMNGFKKLTLQIFATDLDNDAIEKARRGVFSNKIAQDVSPERLSNFFTPDNDGFRVNAAIREMVVFAPQSVTKDPPFIKLDILTCRNMLIYMELELQKKLIALFSYSLSVGGLLLLGSAETISGYNESFIELNSKLKIYRRSSNVQSPPLIDFPFYHHRIMTTEKKIQPKIVENIQTLADQILLQRFSPASVLVNEQGDIVYITGRTGKYLEPVAGKANWNIYAMARDGIRHELPGAFRKATQSFDPVVISNLRIGNSGMVSFVDMTVQRIEKPDSIRGMIMVVFTDVSALIEHNEVTNPKVQHSSSARQKELELEVKRCNEEIQSISEEMQTSQEELKSTNEELQSTNEELQSTNEELTTSKEEMQSLNEELQTVNVELQRKLSDFSRSNDDMKNLLNSTEVATLFLDNDLNIRRFTDHVVKIFKLRIVDIGRPFTDLVNDLEYPEIESHAIQVIKSLVPIETAIETHDKRWFNIRIMPYRTIDNHIDGLVITFFDITTSKKLEIQLKEVNESLREDGKK